jgi:hypothetical protein
MWRRVSHEGLLPVHSSVCLRHRWQANPAPESLLLLRIASEQLLNAVTERGIVGLMHLGQWAEARCFEHIPSLKKLALLLLETTGYLELNADSLPDYGKGHVKDQSAIDRKCIQVK